MKEKLWAAFKKILQAVEYLFIAVIICAAAYYTVLFFHTNSAVEYLESAVRGDIPYEELPPCLQNYPSQDLTDSRIAKTKVDVDRILVLQDLYDGYMWIRTDVTTYDADGKKILHTKEYSAVKIVWYGQKWKIEDLRPLNPN